MPATIFALAISWATEYERLRETQTGVAPLAPCDVISKLSLKTPESSGLRGDIGDAAASYAT